ncbi:MAG: capsular biosynthesis protein [Bacteroidaceae bacterium]|nr:capsular biosynthesis protein [Bacteroidaceae bacterium]
MWPFTRNKTYKDSGLFEGLIDWNTHILPGTDNGVENIEDTIVILREYNRLGISEVWLTPRISIDFPNKIEDLKDKFQELEEKYKEETIEHGGNIKLHLSSINIIDDQFEDRLSKHEFIPFGPEGKHLLFATNFSQEPPRLTGTIKKIIEAGYIPVLNSPERYFYMHGNDYRTLHDDLGVEFIMSIPSLAGLYGPEPMRRSKLLLESNYYKYIGSDNHGLRKFFAAITEYKIDHKYLKKLKEIRDSNKV